jgi:NAD(P)H-hydrate repair Nnr-like enzyme with NAD(P)H-hydrate epimerase domain
MANLIELPVLSTEQFYKATHLLGDVPMLPATLLAQTGRCLALLAQRLLADDLRDRAIVLLAGPGMHGAAGLVAARHLLATGAWVQVVLTDPPETYAALPSQPLAALQALAVPLAWAEEGWELPPADLLIDALLDSVGADGGPDGGRDATLGDPQGKGRELIQLANSSVAPILSLGAPSGLMLASGQCATPHIQANATLLCWLPTVGLLSAPARAACGDLYLADTEILPQLYRQLGFAMPPNLLRDAIMPLTVVEGKAFVSGVSSHG